VIITAIEQVAKNKFKVYADDEHLATLSPYRIRELSLKEGMELDPEKEAELILKLKEMATGVALELLLKRDYSYRELKGRLIKRGFNSEVSEYAVDRIDGYGYLDDLRYTRNFVLQKKGKMSRRMVLLKLRERGVDEEMAEAVLTESDFTDEEGVLRELRKKYKHPEDIPQRGTFQYQKLCRSLTGKGYTFSIIHSQIEDYAQGICALDTEV